MGVRRRASLGGTVCIGEVSWCNCRRIIFGARHSIVLYRYLFQLDHRSSCRSYDLVSTRDSQRSGRFILVSIAGCSNNAAPGLDLLKVGCGSSLVLETMSIAQDGLRERAHCHRAAHRSATLHQGLDSVSRLHSQVFLTHWLFLFRRDHLRQSRFRKRTVRFRILGETETFGRSNFDGVATLRLFGLDLLLNHLCLIILVRNLKA